MMAFTMEWPGCVVPGVAVDEVDRGLFYEDRRTDRRVQLGPGRSGDLVLGGRLVEREGEGALVLVGDHGGREGTWRLRGAHPEARWDALVAAEAMVSPLDRVLAVERARWRFPERAAAGWCELGRGQRWRASTRSQREGLSVLGLMADGAALELCCEGYEGTRVFRVRCHRGQVLVDDPYARASERLSALVRFASGRGGLRWAR